MCLFPYPNKDKKSKSYKYGIKEYSCGACPECLSKRSRLWALRATMEAKYNIGMMVTLTYDQYERDENGRIIGEKPPDTRQLSKRDCQLFFKRLRKRYPNKKIKYILGAEHGKSTGRSHYHAVIFGLQFADCVPYKKSKRGNQTYISKTLKEIWSHGICTVDSLNITASIARYCTKYCAKASGVDDTFMLFSRGIGDCALNELFERRKPVTRYIVEGNAYAIPRTILTRFIEKQFNMQGYNKYVSMQVKKTPAQRISDRAVKVRRLLDRKEANSEKSLAYWYSVLENAKNRVRSARRDKTKTKRQARVYELQSKIDQKESKYRVEVLHIEREFERFKVEAQKYSEENQYKRWKRTLVRRSIYQNARDNYTVYKRYLLYWNKVNELAKINEKSPAERLLALDNKRYFRYKQLAYSALVEAKKEMPYRVPWSKSLSRWYKNRFTFGVSSCQYTPNDTDEVCKIAYEDYAPPPRPVYLTEIHDLESPF